MLIADPSVIGWEGTGQVINDRTDFGNGGWRFSFEDSGEIRQITPHPIEREPPIRCDLMPPSSVVLPQAESSSLISPS